MKKERRRDSRERENDQHWSRSIVSQKTMSWRKWYIDEKRIMCEGSMTDRWNPKKYLISNKRIANQWTRKRDRDEYLDNRAQEKRYYYRAGLIGKNEIYN